MNLDSTSNQRQQQLSNSIVLNLIVNMGLPLSIVESAYFKKFMSDVDPRFKSISRRDIIRLFLPRLQKKCASKLKDICSESKHVSLTHDCWTDRRMRSYFGITLHTIIDDEYKSYLLSFERLYGKHSGGKLAAEFDRVIQLYDLNDKIVRLVTDNASNNLAAFDNIILPGFEDYFDGLEDKESDGEEGDGEPSDRENEEDEGDTDGKKHLQTSEIDDSVYQTTLNVAGDDEYLRLPCFAHCLQLVVSDRIKACSAASSSLRKVAELAKFAHTSTIFSQRLEEFHLTIPMANRTRWNSQFQTVKHVIGIPSSVLNSMLTDLKKTDLILNTKDRKILEEFISLFQLFYESTMLTQGESYSTISLVAPTVLGILYDLEHELCCSTLILTSLCKALISSIKFRLSGLLRHFNINVPFDSHSMSERFSDVIFLISPLLDARFKTLWLNNLHIDVKTRVQEKIRNAFVNFFIKLTFQLSKDTAASNTSNPIGAAVPTNNVPTNNVDSSIKRKCLFPYLNENNKSSSNNNKKILLEVDGFLCEESAESNLLFAKKTHIHVFINLH